MPIRYRPLTAREREVALLAASGHSDKEIAAKLRSNRRTTESHLRNAYRKLGLTNSWGTPRVRLALALTRKDSEAPRVPSSLPPA
jgi:DNA-binding NarL/FixJ family response regulator